MCTTTIIILITHILNSLAIENLLDKVNVTRSTKKLCGFGKLLTNSLFKEPKCQNATYCGEWRDNFFYPIGCEYRNISSSDARKCIGNRTIQFVGDSMIRDLGIEVGLFLSDHPYHQNRWPNKLLEPWGTSSDVIKNSSSIFNDCGFVGMPPKDLAIKNNWKWSIQLFESYTSAMSYPNRLQDILNGKYVLDIDVFNLKRADIAFIEFGLHDEHLWKNAPNMGLALYENVVKKWVNMRNNVSVPSIWMSMNPCCHKKLMKINIKKDLSRQPIQIEHGNTYFRKRFKDDNISYWDSAAPFRTPNICELSKDGIHATNVADMMRVIILFNHLCDENMNWIDNVFEQFL